MKADLILIGNELLNGKTQDLNTMALAKGLFKIGISLRKVHIIQDGSLEFSTSMDDALINSDAIFISGGLGPTQDDVTKSMLSLYLKKEIVYHEQAYQMALSHYERTNREYKKSDVYYHELPLEFTPIKNPAGYAPGILAEKQNKSIYALPGVPSEFRAMLEQIIIPIINTQSEYIMEQLTFKTYGVSEAKIFNELCPKLWNELESYGEVSSLPHPLSVDIGVTITAQTQKKLQEKKQAIEQLIYHSNLKEYIWHTGKENLEELIVKEAIEKKLTLGFAESCTGGLCASRITDVSGSSSVFYGSIVSYANSVKQKSLQVSEKTLQNFGAVSMETAQEMAQGARSELNVDIAVSITGIAGPGGGSKEKPVGTVGIAIATKKASTSNLHFFSGERLSLKYSFSQIALFKMLEAIRAF